MNKIIDILGILLPALIVILGIIRIFIDKPKGVNSLTIFFGLLLLIIGIVRYYEFSWKKSANADMKSSPLTVSKHSEEFNKSLENILTASEKINDAFLENDTSKINIAARELQTALDSLKIDELKADSLIYETALQPYNNTKSEVSSIILDPSINEKKGSLNIYYNELFALLSTVRYDISKLYWLQCDNAFGEGIPGNWFSKTEKSENPYGQKNCAEIKTTLNFLPSDTTKKQ